MFLFSIIFNELEKNEKFLLVFCWLMIIWFWESLKLREQNRNKNCQSKMKFFFHMNYCLSRFTKITRNFLISFFAHASNEIHFTFTCCIKLTHTQIDPTTTKEKKCCSFEFSTFNILLLFYCSFLKRQEHKRFSNFL